MKTLLLIAFFCVSLFSTAQHPAYHIFADEELKGVDIYDVIQDDELNYWFATDQGVIKHDGYSFENIECKDKKGASVFGFVKDSKGIIYCYNLHQQVLKIHNGEMKLYFEIPEEMHHHELNLLIDKQDNLLIQSTGLIKIAPNKSTVEIIKKKLFKITNAVNFHLLPDGSTISASVSDALAIQKDGTITVHRANYIEENSSNQLDFPFTWVTIEDRTYAIERADLEVYEFDAENFTFKYVATLNQALSNQVIRVHTTTDQLWITGNGNGTYAYDSDFKPLFNGLLIYPNKFISDFFSDAEGNLLVSTFDNGVIVIPNTDILGYSLPNDEKIVRITSDGNESLFIGTNLGHIYHFHQGTTRLIYSDPLRKSNEGMEYWKERNLLVFYTTKSACFSKWDGEKLTFVDEYLGAFKNAHLADKNRGLIALNSGIAEVQVKENGSLHFSTLQKLQKRAYCVVQDQTTRSIYAGLSSGLIRLTASGEMTRITYEGKVVYPNSLVHKDGKTYIGTRKHGILVFENDALKKRIPLDGAILKMIIHQQQLFVLSTHGLFASDLDGKATMRLNNSAGLSFEHIADFHISDNTLYITDSESLQFITLEKLFIQPVLVPIHLKSILINDRLSTNNLLASDQRKIQFSFGVSTLKHRDNIRYRYKLQGYESEWLINDYSNNEVTYNALSPGDYTFIVQSLNGDTKSKSITYSFTIDAPFHQKWWFYALIFLASGLLMMFYFFYRIRSIRKKNQARLEKQKTQTDLLEYELKALRSQMNPHFIFNSLNSIQDLILKEETDASYDYIVLFADLVRSTLNHSNKDFIEIDKEIEFIKVYLSLEQLRFKEDFEYTINANGISDIKLPTLLIQPFIENALIHGLIHKEGLKQLSIEFKRHEEKLTCSIRDNGIGRQKAKEIQERQGGHESFALNAIEKRLSILNQHIEYECGFVFNDLLENGKAVGTEVVVTLPYKHLY